MAVHCAQCGVSSTIEDLFVPVRRSVLRRRRLLCPRCAQRHRLGEAARTHRQALGLIAICALVGALRPQWPMAGPALAVASFLLALLPAMLLHEAGHVAVARLLGLRSFGVVVGFGRRLFSGRLLGVPVHWHALPVGAVTLAAHVRADGARWRMVLFAAAGPAANALAVALAWPLPSEAGGWPLPFASADALARGWVAAHALCAAANLVPFHHASPLGRLASDGMHILQALRAGPEQVQEWLRARFLHEALLAREDGRSMQALARVYEGLAAHPDDPQLTSLLGVCLLDTGAGEPAREVFRTQLAGGQAPIERAVTLNNLAWCDFLSAREDRLDEALQCSEEAIEQLGWLAPIQNTRAAVLVWAERAGEALPLLEKGLEGTESLRDRASVACVLALARAALGECDAAKRALEQARSLDGSCPLLARAAAALG